MMMNEVIINLDMLGFLMENIIMSNLDGATAITMKRSDRTERVHLNHVVTIGTKGVLQ